MSTVVDPFRDLTIEDVRALIAETTDPEALDAIIAVLEDLVLTPGEAEVSPTAWARVMFPLAVPAPFAPHHRDLLGWAWAIEEAVRPHPFVGVWARGGGKSMLLEIVCAMLGARRTRRYALYVSEIQALADDHIATIGGLLESRGIARIYPELGRPAVGPFGDKKAWRRNRLSTASGFTVDAIGLDTATRGVKQMQDRPDLIVVDDIDHPHDGPGQVRKKLDTLTRTLFQAGASHCAVVMAQNLINPDGVFGMILDGRSEALRDKQVSGPVPAIAGEYAITETGDPDRPWAIVGGEPTWEGQNREACEGTLAIVGPMAWEAEAQHKARRIVGGMFEDVLPGVEHCTRDDLPDLVRKSIAVDPAVTDTDASDSHGVQCDGIDTNGVIYRLRSWEQRATPGTALATAITWAFEEGVPEVLIEMNTGSDLSGRSVEESWRKVFAEATDEVLAAHPEWRDLPRPKAGKVRATSSTGSKALRASQMHADYERPGRIIHVIGDHDILEAALGRVFVVKPFDLADAAWYSWRDLRKQTRASTHTAAGRTI